MAVREWSFPVSVTSGLPGDVSGLPRRNREGRAPEMSLERAMDDQRLMDQVYASLPAG